MTKWLTNQTIGNSNITDNGSVVTIADTINFTTQGNNTFGNTSADVSSFLGNVTLNENLILAKGLSLGSSYGTAGQVLTSGGGVNVANTWTTPTVGTVTGVTGLYGITVAGTSAVPTIAVTSDTNNLVHLATVKTNPVAADTILINDSENSDVLKQATISSIIALDPARSLSAVLAVGNTSGANEIIMADDKAILFGTGSDSFIKHTGSAFSLINDVGNTTFTNRGDDTDIIFQSDDGSGGTATYFQLDGGQSQSRFLKDVKWDDDIKAKFGTSDDLRIYHNGTTNNGNIENYTGDLYVTQNTDDGDIIFRSDDGSGGVTEYYKIDGGAVETRFSKSTRHFDNVGAYFGDSADLQIYHTGSDSFMLNSTGSLVIGQTSGAIALRPVTGENGILIVENGAVSLYYDNAVKLATTSTGINVTGGGTFSSDVTIGGQLTVNPNASTSVRIGTAGTNAGLIYAAASDELYIGANNSANFRCKTSGQDVQFYGNVEIDGNLTVDGHIIHGGGGGGTGKGGQFTKLYTTGNAGVAGVAFTISRATTGVMIFDVMLTSDTSTACAVAKKYTVVKSYGASPLYNKILDTGPDFDTSDFNVVFAQDTTDFSIKCTITPVYTNTQKIGITLDLGFGQHDATVVMN